MIGGTEVRSQTQFATRTEVSLASIRSRQLEVQRMSSTISPSPGPWTESRSISLPSLNSVLPPLSETGDVSDTVEPSSGPSASISTSTTALRTSTTALGNSTGLGTSATALGQESSTTPSNCSASGGLNSKQGWQNVSILIKKYVLLEPAIPANPNGKASARSPLIKTYPVCLHLETREQFTCKVIERRQEGYDLLAVHHRVGSECDELSAVHEVVFSPRAKCYYMIMPATFGSVHNYLLHKKKFREAEAANIFRQMVKAVQHCHKSGVVLRDLKMGKFVFHDRERTLVRLDTLEDAVILNDLNDDGLGDKHGCPNYVSPEKTEILRCANKKYPGRATDMWGLGVMLYAMLVGRYPFMDDDHSRLFSKIRNGRVTIPDHVSVHAKFLIRCLLHKDPSKRPTCGQILNHVWLRQNESQMSSRNISSRPDNSNASRQNRSNGSASAMPITTAAEPVLTAPTIDQSNPASPSRLGSPSEASIGSSDVKETVVETMDADDQVVPTYCPS